MKNLVKNLAYLSLLIVILAIILGSILIEMSYALEIPSITLRAKTAKSHRSHHHSATLAAKKLITKSDIIASGSNSLLELLQVSGGLQLQDMTGTGSQVMLSLRGFGTNASSNTLLLINGIPITNPDLAPPNLNNIPLRNIELIEITSGTESVLYGDQAVGGVINVITKRDNNPPLTLSCSIGSYSAVNCFASFNKSKGPWQYQVNLINNHTDNYRDHNRYDQHLLSGNVDYSYATGNLIFYYQIANEKTLYPGGLTREQVEEDRRLAANNTDFFQDWNGSFHLSHNQQLNANWRLVTDIASRFMNGEGILTSTFNQSRTTEFIKSQLQGKIGPALISSGFDLESDAYRLNSLLGENHDTLQRVGLFSLINLPLSPRWSLSAGLRDAFQNNQLESPFKDQDSSNSALATTLGSLFELTPNSHFYVRRADTFRFPKADENASTPKDVKALKTQKGVAYESGLDWNYQRLNSNFQIYQLNLIDEITFDPHQTPLQPFGANRNLEPTIRRGFSLAEKYALSEQWTLSGQYNYVNARFHQGPDAGKRIPLVSENIFQASLNYELNQFINFYGEAIYTGNQFAANDDDNIAGIQKGYPTFNLNVRYHCKDWSVTFRVNNLFNKYYNFYETFEPFLGAKFFYPAPGRNFLINLSYLLT